MNPVLNVTKCIKEAILWPFLAAAVVYSFKGPSIIVIPLAFFLALLILFSSSEIEKKIVCGTVIFFQLINAILVYQGANNLEDPLFFQQNLWIANRLLYVVGLTFFLPPLVEPLVTTEKRRNFVIIIACVLIFAAFLNFKSERSEKQNSTVECKEIIGNICTPKDKLEVWYSIETLVDDALLGSAAGLLFLLFNIKSRDD